MNTALTISLPTVRLPPNYQPRKKQQWQHALVAKVFKTVNRSGKDIIAAMRFHWGLPHMLEIIPEPPDLFLLRFEHEQDLHFVLTKGPLSLYGQPLMLQRFKLGMSLPSLSFNSIIVWMQFVGLPFLHRNEDDIRLLLKASYLSNRIHENQTVPAEGHKILTILDATNPIPYGINIDEEGVQTWVLFHFEHLPS